MKTATEITATAIYKITSKDSGKECYAVPSDSQPGKFYITCWDEKSTSWTCDCPAGQNHRACKHARAAQQSIIANKEARHAEQKPVEPVQELHSCDTCWRQIKPDLTTCSVCLGY